MKDAMGVPVTIAEPNSELERDILDVLRKHGNVVPDSMYGITVKMAVGEAVDVTIIYRGVVYTKPDKKAAP